MRHTIYAIATKPLLLAICLAVSFLMSSLVRAQSRAPAVLPEIGLSIEERRQIPPKEAREFGFNFKESKVAKPEATNTAEGLEPQGELEASTTLIVFAIAILAMPLFLWFGLMKQLKKQRAEMLVNNAPISLEEFRAKQEANKKIAEEKKNLPKAS
ncbi:MAG: hypothetical protein A2X86_17970 [Bdellovibrionales bacterium GWA2_49_15]|nr:MAG: hypothetical protein A2X86_17970 [Bdellovibrionales bacterium GWA2_49_15]HAZ11612.1 hypothetical protein [Bdellovibrionales bacterium]